MLTINWFQIFFVVSFLMALLGNADSYSSHEKHVIHVPVYVHYIHHHHHVYRKKHKQKKKWKKRGGYPQLSNYLRLLAGAYPRPPYPYAAGYY